MKPPVEAPRAWGDDRLELATDAERVLVCPLPKAWTARRDRTLTTAEHPGTAVSWGSGIFEVRAAEPVEGGGMRYRLAPWDDRHAIRRMESYDSASERVRESGRAEVLRGVGARWVSILLAPLAGLFPGRVQERMETEFGAPAVAMTISSAIPLLLLGVWGIVERAVGGQLAGGPVLPAWLLPSIPVAMYLAVESALRLASAAAMGRPMGSLPVVIACEAWNELRSPRAAAGRAGVERDDSSAAQRDSVDRFQMLEPLLSFLSPPEQTRLAERFGFDPIRWGRITAAILLAACGSNAVVALVNLIARRFSAADAFWLFAGGAVAAEKVARWRRLAAGEPAGSVLGALVRPLARSLLG